MKFLDTNELEKVFDTISTKDDFESLEEHELEKYYQYLNEYAETNPQSILLYNKVSSNYEYITSNYYKFLGIDHDISIKNFKEIYPKILKDIRVLGEYIDMHEKVMKYCTDLEKSFFCSTFFGVHGTTLHGNQIKLMWHGVPLVLNGSQQSKILLSSHYDIKHLVDGDRYWFRIKAGDKIFSWHSGLKKIRHKEIISSTELKCIKYWSEGLNLLQIANTMNISIHTVKNHFKAAKFRTGARDNTALTNICMSIGLL